jgi:hypothetical protein
VAIWFGLPRVNIHRVILVKSSSQRTVLSSLFALAFASALPAAGANGDEENAPIPTVRIRDTVTLHARTAYLTFTEDFVVTPVRPKTDTPRPAGTRNIIHLLIAPMWVRDGNGERPAFPVLRPGLNLSHGANVRRFAMTRPNGETVTRIDDITADCRYVLTLEFGHMVPEKLTVTVHLSSPTGLRPPAELIYRPSHDGHPVRSGPPESLHTLVHVIADEALTPWTATNGQEEIPQSSGRVRLGRDVEHTFRFGTKEP